jgi:hypothetical protein
LSLEGLPEHRGQCVWRRGQQRREALSRLVGSIFKPSFVKICQLVQKLKWETCTWSRKNANSFKKGNRAIFLFRVTGRSFAHWLLSQHMKRLFRPKRSCCKATSIRCSL